MGWLYGVVLIGYLLLLLLLILYGLNVFYLVFLAYRHRETAQIAPQTAPGLTQMPFVTVQIPIYNERFVAGRIIAGVCALDWPQERLEIQVLDDSTDETRHIIAALIADYQAQGVNITHQHRDERTGYKAGALAEGLKRAQGEFIAIFDADFIPSPDFLQQTMPYFADERIGFLQTRWGHLNEHFSLLTRLQAIAIDAHFMIEQQARSQSGLFMNFNGTAGVWRTKAIHDAGGWHIDTLTEDLDLSYRALLAGWKPIYLRDYVVPGELPMTMGGFRRQQHRWARGSTQCARKLIPSLLASSESRHIKYQGIIHLTGYASQFLLFLLVLSYPFMIVASDNLSAHRPLFVVLSVFMTVAFAPTLNLIAGQKALKRPIIRQMGRVVGMMILGAGMIYHYAFAVMAALVRPRWAVFERTPKYGITESSKASRHFFERLPLSPVTIIEVAMLFYNFNTLRLALIHQNWVIVFYALLLLIGVSFVLALTLTEAVQGWRNERRMTFKKPENRANYQQGEQRQIL